MAVFNPIMAGIAVGKVEGGAVINTTAVNCTVKTLLDNACAGIGAGVLRKKTVTNTRACNCEVSTANNQSDAGIGTGKSIKSKVTDTNAVNCTVSTSNVRSDAGIGAGASNHSTKANAGIGAGKIDQRAKVNITNSKVFKSRIKTGKGAAAINAGHEPVVYQVLVKGQKKNCSAECFDVPGLPGTRNASGPVSDTMTTPPTTPAMLTHSNKIPTGPGSATTTPPTNAPTVTVMPASSSVSTQFATPSLTKSLSPAFIAIIATLGAACVVLFAVIGVRTYLNYCRRSSANAGRNQPMSEQPERQLQTERLLTSTPRNDYQLLPISPVNTSALPARPQSHYQPLTDSQGNTATGGSNPLVGNPAPPPSDYPEQPVYDDIDNYRIPLADGQARTATAGSTMASTVHEPTPGQQSPVHPVMTEPETDSDHSNDEPVTLAGRQQVAAARGERW